MGGVRSGDYRSLEAKDTVESRQHIYIRFLKRKSELLLGVLGQLSWNDVAGKRSAVRFRIEKDHLVLDYNFSDTDEKVEQRHEEIFFEFTSCNFGGRRAWFKCPDCQGRVAIIYCNGRRFLCRQCCDLVYSSQREGKTDRLVQRSKLIRARLGGTGSIIEPFPQKPKGMHWRTYWRLFKQAIDAERPFRSRYFRDKEITALPCK